MTTFYPQALSSPSISRISGRKGKVRAVLTVVVLCYEVNDDAENSWKVVKEGELHEGRSAAGKQEAPQVHERDDRPAVQHKDHHRVQEVVIFHKVVHFAVFEHALGQRQRERRGEERGACHRKSGRNEETARTGQERAGPSSTRISLPIKNKLQRMSLK